ncbi:MAG: hypothetical protein AAGF01_28465 [Cyanobacteria bacterium P01_G01_bin.38]
MAGRSLTLSKTGQQLARQALVRNSLTQKALAAERHIASWSTINRFFNGKPVDRIIFQEICTVLNLDWSQVVEESDIQPQATIDLPPPPSSSSLLATVQQNAAAAREALTPRILERIPRTVV